MPRPSADGKSSNSGGLAVPVRGKSSDLPTSSPYSWNFDPRSTVRDHESLLELPASQRLAAHRLSKCLLQMVSFFLSATVQLPT
jgi:hypothetical protein